MGGLHIEQGALVILGQVITGTGLEDILVNANLDIVSLKTALCDVSSIKKARYPIQILVVCLYKHLLEAYKESGSRLKLDDWADL